MTITQNLAHYKYGNWENTEMNGFKIKIVIADDHALVCHGIALILAQEPDFEVIAQAKSGADAHSLIIDHVPNIALIDYKMPEWDGFKTAEYIRRDMASTRIIILSGVPLEEEVFEKLHLVHGFIHKEVSPNHLTHAIRLVASGERYFDPLISQALLQRKHNPKPINPRPSLSRREQQVLKLMATPSTYHQIAQELIVADSTVHTYVRRIMTKLERTTRTQTVLRAMELGLFE